MPAYRPCPQPGCPVLVRSGRCEKHTKQQDKARGTAQERGYTYQWSQYSKAFLQQHPICGERADGSMDATHSRCAKAGLVTAARCVDHTIPMSRGGSQFDPANHMSACIACNTAKGHR